MTWEDDDFAPESAHRHHTRPTRPTYIPPHLRTINPHYTSPPQHSRSPYFPEPTPFRRPPLLNPSGSSSSRRGGRWRRGGGAPRGTDAPRRSPAPRFLPPKHYPYDDLSEKLDELKVVEEDAVDGASSKGNAINFEAYDDIPVEASGENVPEAVESFGEIELSEGLKENIRRCKYAKPTPIQKHAIPIAVAGRDLMACAQTGSGKTAAFCFPIISGILKNENWVKVAGSGRRGGTRVAYPSALILAPTRELSCQIYEEARKFGYNTGVKIVVVYGGAPIVQQFRNLEKGVDLLVATPGRLVDMIERAKVSLSMIRYLAIDEADQMLDMGFEPQIRKIVQQNGMPPAGKRQTMLFSATFPDEIQRLASDFLSDYIFLTVGRVGSSTDLIAQRIELVQDIDKRNHLKNILRAQRDNEPFGKSSLTLIFVETKRGADSLKHWLSTSGFAAVAIHGDKVQMEREQALKAFKRGATPILVATDVASRGLDIPHVSHVINFDLPKDIDSYVHRIGRTGRAGRSGLATAFFSDKNMPLAKALAELMKESNQDVPSWLSQYAERSFNDVGQGRRYGGSKFGAHDFRNDSYIGNGNSDYSSAYYGGDSMVDSHSSPTRVGYVSPTFGVRADFYGPASHGTGFGQEPVVAGGWE
ncbi:DEAD-box ATP-dependent RNA helicase 52 [Turnera subulata]|uniref:RNA helicase n=1 Tax=Turnera subulata TaxID=218843 RepID=A0A9Q0G7K7_9ROSI|nr:DEAD-box ATP-dependent RNA helicase 52 [Turnera subulata]